MKKLSICIITLTFPPECTSGGGIYSYEIAKRLANYGYDVKVITCLNNISSYKDSKIKVYSVRSKNLILFGLLAWRKFREEIKDKVDILHGNHIYHWLFCLWKPKNIKKIITTTHNSYLQRFHFYGIGRKLSYPLLILLEQLVYKSSAKIISVSKLTAQYVLKYWSISDKAVIIPNGVDENIFKPLSLPTNYLKERFSLTIKNDLILFVGRLDRNKSPFSVIKALKKVKSSTHFLIIGHGRMKSQLKKVAVAIGVKDRVHFMEKVSYRKMPTAYNSADLFILVSKSEGMPFSLIEAGACGLPLLATKNATGLMPIVETGQNGYLVENDNFKDLAKKIELALANRDVMGKKSRQIILSRYTWNRNFQQLNKILKDIINE